MFNDSKKNVNFYCRAENPKSSRNFLQADLGTWKTLKIKKSSV